MSSSPKQVAYLVSHPIQYQAPFLRYLAREADFELTTFFLSDFSTRLHRDRGFDAELKWDVPLLEGYRSVTLSAAPEVVWNRPFPRRELGARLLNGGFDALWIHGWAQLAQLWTLLRAGQKKIPVLLRGESVPAARSLLRRSVLRKLLGRAQAFLPIGRRNRAFYRSLGFEEGALHDVPYAVDNDFFRLRSREAAKTREELRSELDLQPGRPVLLFASKLIARKRPEDLLTAHASLRRNHPGLDPYLLIVGEGPLRGALESRARCTSRGDVRFLGFQNQSRLPALYDLADVFVLPSRFETWGLVLNEAMNAACPVVASEGVGAVPDLVVPGVTGYSYPAGDTDRLTELLADLLGDEPRRLRMGQAALRQVARLGFAEGHRGLAEALEQVA